MGEAKNRRISVSSKDLEDLDAAIHILRDAIASFHRGNRHSYRVVAGQIRLLLCDGRQSLLLRLFPSLRLHPPPPLPEPSDGLVLQLPGVTRLNQYGMPIVLVLFDERRPRLPLEEWLRHPLLNASVTVGEFIRSVADKEAVHSDKDYNDTLGLARSVILATEESHKAYMVAIGEYVLRLAHELQAFLLEKLKEAPHGSSKDQP